jgi:hypothetical protein
MDIFLKILIFSISFVFLIFCGHNHQLFSFENKMEAQLKPSWELRKLDSAIYEFLMTTDRESFAKAHHIFFMEGRLRVYIVMDPDISQREKEGMIETYRIKIEKESENLLRATVPVEELTSLAKENLIWSIRLPEKPVVQ